MKAKVTQSCLTLRPHGLYSTWNSPGQNSGVCSLSLLQGIFQTQVSCIAGRFFTGWATREARYRQYNNIYIYSCIYTNSKSLCCIAWSNIMLMSIKTKQNKSKIQTFFAPNPANQVDNYKRLSVCAHTVTNVLCSHDSRGNSMSRMCWPPCTGEGRTGAQRM